MNIAVGRCSDGCICVGVQHSDGRIYVEVHYDFGCRCKEGIVMGSAGGVRQGNQLH